jgi:hypothetical protein
MSIHIIKTLVDGYLVGDNYGNTAYMTFEEYNNANKPKSK